MPTKRELLKLGIDETEVNELNDKWMAYFHPNPGNPSEGLTPVREADGKMAAYENLIDLQERMPFLLPGKDPSKIDTQFIKRHISYGHVQKEFSV